MKVRKKKSSKTNFNLLNSTVVRVHPQKIPSLKKKRDLPKRFL